MEYIKCFSCQGTGDARNTPNAITLKDDIVYGIQQPCFSCGGKGWVQYTHLSIKGGRK